MKKELKMWTLISLIFISILFLPNIPISSSLHIRPEDFFIFLAAVSFIVKDFPRIGIPKTPYTWIILTFLGWMTLSIVLNNNILIPSSLFEIVKFFKVIIVFILIYRFYPKYKEQFHRLINICFWILVAINLFQFFDPLSLNNKIWNLYIADNMLPSLLINHRISGLIGNPNVNGVLFLIFTAYFLSRFNYHKIDLHKAIIAAVIVLLTQSRTDFIALVLILPYVAIATNRLSFKGLLKIVIIMTISISLMAIALLLIQSAYILSLWTTPIGENSSFQVRVMVWEIIYKAILESPIIGHGGNKEFFYSQGINAESQYVFTAFLYGFVGLAIYFSFMFYPFYYFYKNKNTYTLMTAIFSIAFIVTSVTNAPLNDYRIFILAVTFLAISCIESKKNTCIKTKCKLVSNF
jgi:O-antigen ligase